MEEKAIRERWPVTPGQRRRTIERLSEIVEDPSSDERVVVSAARALMAADAQTLAWLEHEWKKAQAAGDGNAEEGPVATLLRALIGRQKQNGE